MARTRLYTAIFLALLVFSTTQALLEFTGLLAEHYWPVLGAIMVLSSIKALLVAGYFQHLRFEPRSVSYLMAGSLVIVLALSAGAAYSIL